MTTRLDIARARARVALARLTGEVLPDDVAARAAMDISTAPRLTRAGDPFVGVAGVHARGRDFGTPRPAVPDLLLDQAALSDAALIESGIFTASTLAAAKARVARGELHEHIRQNWQRALDESLIEPAVAARLGIGRAKLRWMLGVGDLFAFVANAELHYPTWQFSNAPGHPVLPQLSRLVEAFPEGLNPASILGFMTTPHSSTRVNGRPVAPIEWLAAGQDAQPLVDILESYLL
ncbi:hypothetical protein [Curtobacterium sp. VKM Ac-2884]|uniref:hypothetical protein n=1 Tax=Curtobacterium sp. VKM Ac-2884 TaxID=2783818 RepID=UPI00188A50D0|nr:hypothetical protein [Curtobacterium sp. VKM Ac-2884]MBF4603141.1 hypothetical protein [Curtobacterium sp. VKM Ac-2884]